MSARDSIAAHAARAAADLSADAELQREATCEFAAHLECGVEERMASGQAPAAALSATLSAFGDPADVGRELVDSLRPRMRRRRVARIALWAVLLPMAIAGACGSGHGAWQRVDHVMHGFRSLTELYPGQSDSRHWQRLADTEASDPLAHLPAEALFLFRGDASRATLAEQQRAIWEQAPRNRVYFGNYISALVGGTAMRAPAALETALLAGIQLDPENSRYDYLRALALAESAAAVDQGHDGGARLEIVDRERLDRAMAMVLVGHEKRGYRRYALEMLRVRLAALPPFTRLEELLSRTRYVAGIAQPDVGALKRLAVLSNAYAALLVEEGQHREALRHLHGWRDLARKLNADAFSYVDLAAVSAIAETGRRDGAALLDQIGMHELASVNRRSAGRIGDVIGAEDRGAQIAEARFYEAVQESGSLYARLVTPMAGLPPYPPVLSVAGGEPLVPQPAGIQVPSAVRTLDASKLSTLRWAEHLVLEQLAVAVGALVLVGAALCAQLMGLRGRRAAILPGGGMFLRVLITGVLLPILLYACYSRGFSVSGRAYGIAWMGARFVYELVLLVFGGLFACTLIAGRLVGRRLHAIGQTGPEPVGMRRLAIWATVYAVLWGCSPGLAAVRDLHDPAWLIAAVLLLGLLLDGATQLAIRLFRARRNGFAAVSWSSAPLFAAAAALLLALVNPALRAEEARLLQEEELYHWSNPDGFANAEYRSVQRVKTSVRRELESPDV